MASNVGEMSGMKDARHMILWLFFGLLPMLGSCDFRDMLDDYPVSGVQIKLDWKGVTDKLPQTMRITLAFGNKCALFDLAFEFLRLDFTSCDSCQG